MAKYTAKVRIRVKIRSIDSFGSYRFEDRDYYTDFDAMPNQGTFKSWLTALRISIDRGNEEYHALLIYPALLSD